MKTINFSPFAKNESKSKRYFGRKSLVLFGSLIFLVFGAIIFWHEPTAVHQDFSFLRNDAPPSEDIPSEGENNNLEKPAPEADREEEPFTGYYLKTFTGVVKSDVEKVADYLLNQGFSPRIVRESGYTLMYNVYVDPDASQSITSTVDGLIKDGFTGYAQEISENQYSIRVGSCYYLESAKHILENLKSKGYSGNIVQEETAVKFYSLYLGQYPDMRAALEEQKRLMLMGFRMAIVTKGFLSPSEMFM